MLQELGQIVDIKNLQDLYTRLITISLNLRVQNNVK